MKNTLDFLKGFILTSLLLCLTGCLDLSDVGEQDDSTPIAEASVIGAQSSDAADYGTMNVRAGTDVLLSGKDSDGVDDPILQFDWAQTDSSGIDVVLIERSRNSRVFTAPEVSSDTELSFELTVTDADGVTATDEISVTVVPVNDVDGFLVHPNSPSATLTFLVAPDSGETTGASEEFFDLSIEVLARWRNKAGDYDQLSLETSTISGSFPANYTGPADVTANSNPRLNFELPDFVIDNINQYFETEERERRLELYEIESAFLELNVTLVPVSTTVAFKVYATDGNDLIVANDISRISVSGDEAFRALNTTSSSLALTNTPADAVLLDTGTNQLEQSLYVEELKGELGIENVQTGRNYYKLIDPTDQFVYLKDWLSHAGFTDEYGNDVDDDSIAHAMYVNNYDLGFGRDMWTRVADNGNVYSYVVNYPSLEAAVQGQGDFAVVVMEYSENPDPDGENAKIVKFYSYVPDKESGDYIRANTMNFDGRGEKAVPGVCTACHYQSSESVGRKFTDVSEADLDSTFLPWDLDSFLYSSASDEDQVDPSYNQSNVESVSDYDASREAQEAQLKKLNEAALATYLDNPINPDDPDGPRRHDASIELLHCMYGDPDRLEEDNVLPSDTFDSECVQPGWVGQEDLYHDVYARYCRACHTQFFDNNSPESNFDSYDDFVSTSKLDVLKQYVFEQGRMPLARLTMDRFWIDFDGGDAPAELLRAHLDSIGETVDTVPGQVVAAVTANGVTLTDDETYPNQVNQEGTVVVLDAISSLFADTFNWNLISPDCVNVPEVSNVTLPQITLDLADGSFFPCTYYADLTVSNDAGSDDLRYILRTTRYPESVNVVVDLDDVGYVSGDDSVTLDLDSEITSRGDDTLSIHIDETGVTVNNDGTITISLDTPLQGYNNSFAYTVTDIDGSESEQSTVSLTVDEIVPALTNNSPTASSVQIDWTVPTGFVADSYEVYRKLSSDSNYANSPIASYGGGVFSHTSADLQPDEEYNFKVVAGLGSDSNESNEITVSTQTGKPSGLLETAATTNSVSISWTSGPGGAPDCYNVYANSSKVGNCVGTTTFDHTSLDANQTYVFEVSAVFGASESDLSDSLSTNTDAVAPTMVFNSETDNSDDVINGTTSITLNWSDSVNASSPSYQVYSGTSPGSLSASGGPTSLMTAAVSTSSYTQYYLQVCVIDLDGGEVCTSEIGIRTSASTNDVGTMSLSGGTCIGCHAGLYKTKVQNKANQACFYNGDFTLNDCTTSMNFSITGAQEDILESWIENGLLD